MHGSELSIISLQTKTLVSRSLGDQSTFVYNKFMMSEQKNNILFETKQLSKHFGGLKAVDGVSMAISRGGLHSIIGPNGAGKTTFLNLLSGVFPVMWKKQR